MTIRVIAIIFKTAAFTYIAYNCGWVGHHHETRGQQKEEVDLGDAVHLEQLEVELRARVGCLHKEVHHEEGDAHGRG